MATPVPTAGPQHAIEIETRDGELGLRLRCNAPEGAVCRMRPPEENERESWSVDDDDLIPGDCWAVDWVDSVGIEDAVHVRGENRTLASVPVNVNYDEGVHVTTVDPEETP